MAGTGDLNRDEIETILKPFYPHFCTCIEGAWEEYYARVPSDVRAKLGKRARANVIHDLMVHRALLVFAGVPGVNLVEAYGYTHLSFGGRVLIRLKKLDAKGRPANYLTPQVKRLNSNATLADIPQAVRMVAGYQVDKLQAGLLALLIVAPEGRSIGLKLTIKTYGDDNQTVFKVEEITHPVSGGTKLIQKDAAVEKAKENG